MAAAAPARTLRFSSVDEAIAEAERLVDAERAGRVRQIGNWPLGQALGHLATWANFAHDGYPAELTPPALVRWIARMMRNRFITKPMPAGVRIRGLPDGTVGLDPLPVDEGLERFRTALRRLSTTAPTIDNPVFGKLTHEQWVQLNLRHAELHLGFFGVD